MKIYKLKIFKNFNKYKGLSKMDFFILYYFYYYINIYYITIFRKYLYEKYFLW